MSARSSGDSQPVKSADSGRRPLGGKRAEQAQARRERVLEAALDLFCEHGYAGTSTARIAKAAGVAAGLIFHQFGSKEALLLAVAAREQTFAGRVRAIVELEQGSARAVLTAIAAGLAEVSARERAFIAFAQAEAQVNESLRSQIAAGSQQMLDALEAIFAGYVASGELRDDLPVRVALEGFFGGFMFFVQHRAELEQADWHEQARHFADGWAQLCWRGMARNPDEPG